jgi:hypothetical protein
MNRNTFIANGIFLFVGTIALTYYQTKAYGSNFVPQSTPEAIVDAICILMFLTGYVLATIGLAIPKK